MIRAEVPAAVVLVKDDAPEAVVLVKEVVVKTEVVSGAAEVVVEVKVVCIATQSVTFVEADEEFVPIGQSLQVDAWVSSWYSPGLQSRQDVAPIRLQPIAS